MDYFDLSAIDAEIAEPIVIPKKSRIAAKLASRLAAGAVSSVIVSLIHQNVTTYSKTQTVKLYVGAYVLGAMVADKAEDYVVVKAGETFAAIENFLWIPVEPEIHVITDLEPTQNDPDKQ